MKVKLIYLFCLFALFIHAQKDLSLERGNCILYKGHVFAYGFKNTSFVIYKLRSTLQIVDSTSYDLGKNKAIDYLGVETDTLHETLNFYLQKKDKQNITLLRFDNKFKLANEFKTTDVTKLDPFALFDHQKFVHKKNVYAVKTAFDSTGKQYYLSKYELQNSNDKPFDYKFKWQFNFEKKFIKNVNVFYADTSKVLVYVHVNDGERKGQWVLKINAATGLIIRGKKVSSNPAINYRYGSFYLDSVSKNLFVLGQLTMGEQLSSPTPTLFILQFDSLLELNSQKQVVQRITAANPKAKAGGGYIFQISKVKYLSPNTYNYQMDLYKNNGIDFKYSNTHIKQFSFEDEAVVSDPIVIREFPEVENFYFTTDKKDLNGKLFADTSRSADRLFYVQPVFKVNQAFKLTDELPVWVLKKTDPKTNTINYSLLKPGLKVYETKPITTLSKEENPGMLFFGKDNFILFFTKNGNVLHLENGNW